jgi:DNA processing protein
MVGESKKFWLGFNLISGIGPARLDLLLNAFGDAEAAWRAMPGELRAAGLGEHVLREFVQKRQSIDLDREWARLEKLGIRLLTWRDEEYPARLLEIEGAPPLLYVRGEIEPADRVAVAVVGTRRPTAYGRAVARDISGCLADAGVTVVSGLARGIDGIAHRAALESGGRTLAVFGSGLDTVYPPEHRRLAEDIASGGALLSDYPLGTRPEAGNFPPRNRIISGLALLVVIVEAGEGSGAIITADFAASQGRDVFAVPGSIYSRASRGAHRLILSGARLMSSPQDVLEALNLDLAVRQEPGVEELPEDETERRIYQALTSEPRHVDELHALCGLPVADVAAALAILEIKGRVRQVGGMQFVRLREPKAGYRVE